MKISIIGYSGSGKSTLAETLARYYSAIIETGLLMAITLGAAMRREWSKPTRLSS